MNAGPTKTPKIESIAANGGWKESRHLGRPRQELFSMLALLWCFPSAGAAWILTAWLSKTPLREASLEILARTPLECWIALGVLLSHAVFAILAWRYSKTEKPREIVTLVQNPDVNPKNFY